MKKILFVVPFPKNIYPSERFRLELYEDSLKEKGFDFDMVYFWDYYARSILYKEGMVVQKFISLIKGFLRRIKMLFIVYKYDYVFVLREVAPIGPPFFEWMVSKVFRKKLIYDIDDAIWIPQMTGSNSWTKFAKSFWKVKYICKWAYKVSVGNNYLQDFASKYNNNVTLNPTCVDTEKKHNRIKEQHTSKIVIGWTGSFSTLHYLNEIVPVIKELEKKYSFEFLVIADQNPNLPLKSFKFIEWNGKTEIDDLLTCNVGIMPLVDDEYSNGKCGFKIIQFLSLGIPVVASPVGVNAKIVDEHKNGFLCKTQASWINALEKLISDADVRQKMGADGRNKIVTHYSKAANTAGFLSLFK
jgi:glycosyltransferase involved in cell wall biosynthesis